MNSIVFVIPVMAIIGLIVMALKTIWVKKQDAGDAAMQDLSNHIHNGAMAFLRAEWKVLGYYVVIAAILLALSGTSKSVNSHWIISISFIVLYSVSLCSNHSAFLAGNQFKSPRGNPP